MHGGFIADGFPDTAAGCVGGGYSASFEDMCESADAAAAEAVGALVESLSPIRCAAIHHCYLSAVYRFPRGGFDEALFEARCSIGRGLVARGFY